jgi:polar amino acid transport system permease protein
MHLNPSKPSLWRRIHHSPFFDIALFLIFVAIIVVFFLRSSQGMGYDWQWQRIPSFILSYDDGVFTWGPLAQGLWVTLEISAISLVFAFVIGLTTALSRLSSSFVARTLSLFYLETIRNTPLMIQIFFIYFVVGPVIGLERFPSAVLALSLFEGAYASEIFRAGIVSISRSQWEASHSLGLTQVDTYRFVILPQAIRRILPPLTSQLVSLIKDSALVSTIAIYDLTMQAQALISETFLTFELWFTVAAIYLVVTVSLSFLVNFIEVRLQIRQ